MNTLELAELLFPNISKTPQDYEEMYPKRELSEKAMVTRFAPSPTGFVHMGSLYVSFINYILSKQSGGLFYLRIEDTDQKRKVENGVNGIINDLLKFDYHIEEGPLTDGAYGPYIQSERKEIYQTFAKDLVQKGLAYPCFCDDVALKGMHELQEVQKQRLGYHGMFATCRNLSMDDIKEKLAQGIPYVIRLKSPGDYNKQIAFHDCIKGTIMMPENDLDIVILKSDGIPTYHFAHAIDDHFMRTTHVIRGDEWVSSIPVHLQLFEVLGFEAPKYAHIAPLTKKDGEGIRKLSKRHDPECAIHFYHEEGIPHEVIKLYLATIANTNFEGWYLQNPDKTISDFTFEFKKMPVGGSLYDLTKLMSISKIYFSHLKANKLYEDTLTYCEEYDDEFATLLKKYKDYSILVLNVEREVPRPRKDIACYKDVRKYTWYMYDEIYFKENPYINVEKEIDFALVHTYLEQYFNENDTKEEWMNKIRVLATENGYAGEVKAYKANPEAFKGHIGDVCEMIRVVITSLSQTPDLYELLKLLGRERALKRLCYFENHKNSNETIVK